MFDSSQDNVFESMRRTRVRATGALCMRITYPPNPTAPESDV